MPKETKPHALFDAVKDAKKLKNDAELSRFLKVNAPQISRIRSEHLELSDTVRVQVARQCGWTMKRIDELAPTAEQSSH
jgi:hypothetical protein